MCGIAGVVDLDASTPADRLTATVLAMARRLRHRGPDDEGAWVDAPTGVALASTRLSIVDPSPHGHQPMQSADGRYVVVYNGEIYNFQALRAELESVGCRFRGHSDTEVMLAAVTRWTLGPALERFDGMFALALWDREERALHLVRDRLGEKPLYYGWTDGTLVFGSELKALRSYAGFRPEIDRRALAMYAQRNSVPAPYSIYVGVSKLPPGTHLTVRVRDKAERPRPLPYWSAADIAQQGLHHPLEAADSEAEVRLHDLLLDAVRLRMIADVPLGAFLSGGVDSSTIVALMQALSDRPIKTFSIGFREAAYDEASHAAAVARHLGTQHTELYVTAAEAAAVIPRLPTFYDEPFADSSQIPTILVSDLARQQVKVSLSGDGGDELFAGYNRYLLARQIPAAVRRMPRSLREVAARGLTALPTRAWDSIFERVDPLLPGQLRPRTPGLKIQKLVTVLEAGGPDDLYWRVMSSWADPASLVRGVDRDQLRVESNGAIPDLPTLAHRMMLLDTVTYLPDDILVKLDRASMGVGLEARVPFLDHRLVEFAWRVPLGMKIRGGKTKWLLRRVLDRYVPRELVERPKMGFAVDVGGWLRGPLRGWAQELLDEGRLNREGFFNPAPIRQKLAEHLQGRRDWQDPLWCILMFQAWLSETTRS